MNVVDLIINMLLYGKIKFVIWIFLKKYVVGDIFMLYKLMMFWLSLLLLNFDDEEVELCNVLRYLVDRVILYF